MGSNEEKNGYIKWKTFWSILLVIIGVLYFIANAIIANDRVRACEDTRIEEKWGRALEKVEFKIDKQQSDITDIKVMVAKIK
jgi:hypothetical protein